MNLSLVATGGEVLIVSQFTLYGDWRKGNCPSFTDAASPAQAARFTNTSSNGSEMSALQ
jgi:D-aminoacyl-tRNA deacylase